MLQQGRVLHNQVPYDSVDPSEWGVLDSDSDTSTTVSEPDEEMGEEKARISHREVAGPARKTEADLSRQTGDFDCYKIYLRSIGMVTLAVLVVMSVAHIAMNKMPRTCVLVCENTRSSDANNGRGLAAAVDGAGHWSARSRLHGRLHRLRSRIHRDWRVQHRVRSSERYVLLRALLF